MQVFDRALSTASPFWKALCKEADGFQLGTLKEQGEGTSIHFRSDFWIGEAPLATLFPHLFTLAHKPNITVAEARRAASGRFKITFQRPLFGVRRVAETQTIHSGKKSRTEGQTH